RGGPAGEIDAVAVGGDGEAGVLAGAAIIGGPEQGAVLVEPGEEGVALAGPSLVHGVREAQVGDRGAAHVEMIVGVDGDAVDRVLAVAAEIGGPQPSPAVAVFNNKSVL